jgi:hypothetical protein
LDGTLLANSLREFFWSVNTGLRTDLILRIITKIEELYKLMKSPEASFRFYSTSLLLIYEADNNELNFKPAKVDVRMIDFAHTFPRGDREDDTGYMLGLRNLISLLEHVVEQSTALPTPSSPSPCTSSSSPSSPSQPVSPSITSPSSAAFTSSSTPPTSKALSSPSLLLSNGKKQPPSLQFEQIVTVGCDR